MEQYTMLNELDNFMQGQISERMRDAMSNVSANILDPNTNATAARKSVREITIKPNKDRVSAALSMNVKSTRAGVIPAETNVNVGLNEDGEYVIAERSKQVTGQLDIYGNEIKPNVIALPANK